MPHTNSAMPNIMPATTTTHRARLSLLVAAAVAGVATASGCSGEPRDVAAEAPSRVAGTIYTLKDTAIATNFQAAGTAAPMRQATLGTKLMGSVTAVLAHEGDAVKAGQPLVRLDARELNAQASKVEASTAEAKAVYDDAITQAGRIRALYADSAATRAQLDAVETALARADAGLAAARAAAAELDAVSAYAVIRAPFAGVVTRRFVDPGSFAAPGAPLLTVQDASQLRITATVTPEIAQRLRRGQSLDAVIEREAVRAVVEGVVPSAGGNLYSINAVVRNPSRALLAGTAATLSIPLGEHTALVVPTIAIVRQGDLTGVTLRTEHGDEIRWVRLGHATADLVEVSAGLRAGDQVVIPTPRTAPAAGRE